MNDEIQKYYEDLFEMYSSDGWKALMKDLEDHAKQYNSIAHATDEKSLYFQKGRLDEVNFLLNHEETMKQAYEDIHATDL